MEYIHGIINDLTTDTGKLRIVLNYYDEIIPLMDSGRKNFYKLQQPGSLRDVSNLQMSIAGFQDFIYTDVTLQQLKSAGGLLLIRNKGAVDSILNYYAAVKAALMNEKVLGELMVGMHHSMGGILNMQPLLESVGRSVDPTRKKVIMDSLNKLSAGFLLTRDPVITGQFYNDYTYYQTIASLVRFQMEGVKEKARRVCDFLKKEYEVNE